MAKFPFQLSIRRIYPEKRIEILSCTALLRTIPDRRQVFEALWNDRSVVVKVFSHYIIAKRHLKREWRGLSELKRRGLSSPAPLFYGRTENGLRAMVIEKISDSSTALDVFNRTAEKTGKLDLLILVCSELAKQHHKGVLQKDLHLGNFLWQKGKLFTLDTAQIRLFPSEITRKRGISQLALLACLLPEGDTESIAQLCEEYFKARSWHFGNSDKALFQKRLTTQRKRGIKHGLKCLRTSKRHLRLKIRNSTVVFDKDFCLGAETLDFVGQIDTLMDKGHILKKGNTCYVSHLMCNGKDVVIKRYNHKGFIHSLRHTIKTSRARRGWLHAHRLKMLKIATPKPLAYIEQRRGLLLWQSYLITEYVEGQKLYDFLRNGNLVREQRSIATRKVKDLLDKLDKYRITHGDLKHTNILITDNDPVLTDLDAMQAHKLNCFYKFRRLKDLERFLREINISPAMESYCRMSISGKMDSFRGLSGNFDKVQMRDWIIHIRKDFIKYNIVPSVLVNVPPVHDRIQFTSVPSSDYTRVFKCSVAFNGVIHAFYLKHYLCRSMWDFAKHLFRPSRARRAFEAALMLEKNGFDTPAVIGLFERRLGLFCTNNLLLTKEVENATAMPELFKDICQSSGKNALARKRTLIKAFAETIGQMHAKGIFHGDLRLGNVLVVREGQKWRFFFIDNERTKKFYRLPDRLRSKNLVQVNMFTHGISNTDRLRFFKIYFRANPDVESHYKRWARKISANTNLRLLRKGWFEN